MKHQIINLEFKNKQYHFDILEVGSDKLINADQLIDDGRRFKITDPWKGSVEEFEVFTLIGNGNNITLKTGEEIAYNVLLEISTNTNYIITSQEFDSDFEVIDLIVNS